MVGAEPRCNSTTLYSGCSEPGVCPCSSGPIGEAVEVGGLRDLIRSQSAASIVRWPKLAQPNSLRRQLFWLRKFRGVSLLGGRTFPACFSRASTLALPCDIPSSQLLQTPPPYAKNRTHTRPVFWLVFAWSSQYAHWTLEHLPRLWYFLQLTRLLQRPPWVLVPPAMAPWQRAIIEAIPTTHPKPLARASILPLAPPQFFSTLYVPGMPAHVQLLWTTQATLIWDRMRQLAARPHGFYPGRRAAHYEHRGGAADRTHAADDRDEEGMWYSFRTVSERGPGSGRLLIDAEVLGEKLNQQGFRPLNLADLTIQQKYRAFERARVLVVECGSAMANFMLMPRGLVLIALCMVNHTSSRGCFSQVLATHYTAAAVHTLKIGVPVNATEYATNRALGGKNNVQAHTRWTVDVSLALPLILSLCVGAVRTERAEAWRDAYSQLPGWLPSDACRMSILPRACDGSSSPRLSKPKGSRSWSSNAKTEKRGMPGVGASESTDDVPWAGSSGAVFTLLRSSNNQWHPTCLEVVTAPSSTEIATYGRQERGAARQGATVWAPCRRLLDYCEAWRWCVKQHVAGSTNGDLRENCWRQTPMLSTQ
ncbi:hypothetical protein AB1Y20_008070 [Prymnesium parvum]